MRIDSSTSNYISNYSNYNTNAVSDRLNQIARNVRSLALPALAICAVGSLPTVDSGPVAYAACVAACEALATVATGGPGAAFIGQCIQACYPAWFLPTP